MGDTVNFSWYDGTEYKETEYKIAGEISDEIFADEQGGKIFAQTEFFLLPDRSLQGMMPPGFNLNSNLLIEIADLNQESEIRQQMNELVENTANAVMDRTLYNLYLDSREMYARTSAVIWGFSGFLLLFALINLVNTLIAVAFSRKHEFSILRAVGMGQKQLQRTIQYEGIWLSLWNVLITLIFGTSIGYGIIRYLTSIHPHCSEKICRGTAERAGLDNIDMLSAYWWNFTPKQYAIRGVSFISRILRKRKQISK